MKLDISGLTKNYGNHRVLDRLSLGLDGAHRLAIIGPSGGGKTTLLRILAGLEIPDAGDILFNGEQMRFQEAALHRHRLTVGIVFQAYNLFPHLTALQNITLPLEKVHGHSPASAREIAIQLLHRFQLNPHASKRPAELSGGQRQRVAIARAVAIHPRALLFDEPTSALDPEMTAEVLDMIRELSLEGHDIVLVTHEMGFARAVADRIAFLSEGRILEYGEAEQLFTAPTTVQCRRFMDMVLKY